MIDLSQRPRRASDYELMQFHTEEYVKLLKKVGPHNLSEMSRQMAKCRIFSPSLDSIVNLGFVGQYDCPVFDGLFDFCSLYTGGSLGALLPRDV
jgi:acetoin utilization deacetylase AcuC-like enzyme